MTRNRFLLPSVLLAILLVALALNHRNLRLEYEDFRAAATEPRAGLLLPTFIGKTLSGQELRIGDTEARPQVLWFFRSDCPYCNASLPELRKLRERLLPFEMDLIPVSLDEDSLLLAQFAVDSVDGFSVLPLPERKLVQLYRIRAVPDLRILDSQGRVLFTDVGVLTPGAADSVVAVVERWFATEHSSEEARPLSSNPVPQEEP